MMEKPFGDGEEYMSLLVKTGYIKPENIFSLTENGEILSTAVFFEAKTRLFEKVYILSYVYTPEKYRNKGYSSRLISEMLSASEFPVVVFPATKSLFSYYGKFGFSPCSFSERHIFEKNRKTVRKIDFSEEVYAEYLKSRKNCDVFKPKTLFAAAIKEAEYCDGGLFSDGESYAFSYIEKGVRIVTEPFGADNKAVAEALSGVLILPSEKKDEPLAMIYNGKDLFADNFLNFNQYI